MATKLTNDSTEGTAAYARTHAHAQQGAQQRDLNASAEEDESQTLNLCRYCSSLAGHTRSMASIGVNVVDAYTRLVLPTIILAISRESGCRRPLYLYDS